MTARTSQLSEVRCHANRRMKRARLEASMPLLCSKSGLSSRPSPSTECTIPVRMRSVAAATEKILTTSLPQLVVDPVAESIGYSRQIEFKLSALATPALYTDRTTMKFDDSPGDDQSKTRPLSLESNTLTRPGRAPK